jgi:dihydrodipicolinate synthase/N-acetylneuraminate lyase
MFKMKGVVPPMITPFDKEGNVDYLGLEKLVDYLSDNVDGLFVTGSYGCGALMTVEERKKVVETTIKAAKGRVPVVVMTGSTNNRTTVELSKHAEAAGAEAVSAVGPYYFTHKEDSIKCFYEDIVKSVNIPIYVYNNPGFQGYPMSLDLLKSLKELGVSGIKDATFDILLHATYMRVLKDDNFDVALGTEAMFLSACALGCEAFIPGLGNAFPEICKKMYAEGMGGDFKTCKETQFKINKMRDIMYLARSTQLAVYAMLEIRGIVKAYPRKPFIPATETEKKKIKEALIEQGMI